MTPLTTSTTSTFDTADPRPGASGSTSLSSCVRLRRKHGRRARRIVVRPGRVLRAKLSPLGSWFIADTEAGDQDEDRWPSGTYEGTSLMSVYKRLLTTTGTGPFIHTLFPKVTIPAGGTFTVEWSHVWDPAPIEDPEVSVYDHVDRPRSSPRSGGCGGLVTRTPVRPLVVAATPVLASGTTHRHPRSGLKPTIKSRYKPP